MRVLQVADFYPPTPGGLEAHVERLSLRLAERGHEVSVVAGGQPKGSLSRNGIPVMRSAVTIERLPGAYGDPSRPFAPPWVDSRLARTIDEAVETRRPQVIHAHGWCAVSAARVASRRDLPLVVTLHDYGLLCPMRNLLRGDSPCGRGAGTACMRCPGSNQTVAKRMVLAVALESRRRRTRVQPVYLAVSREVATRHLAASAVHAVTVVPNFIDLPPARPLSPPPDGRILFVGPADRPKGWHIVSQAHELLVSWDVPATLHHVGGPEARGEERFVVESGRLTGADLERAYAEASVVAVPSLWADACPTVALEAMAAGRPVVASAVGGLKDIVDHGRTGLLVRHGDATALASALGELLEDGAKRARMGAAAYKRAPTFSSETVVPIIESIYAQVTR